MPTKFFTNKNNKILLKKFEGVFESNKNIHCFDILVGYFRASGYFRVRPLLENVPKIRILVGINVDKLIQEAQEKGNDFLKSIQKTKEEFIANIKEDIAQANYDYDTEQGMIQFIEDIINQKVQVKAHPDKKIHAKVYILRPEPFNPDTFASVITGSSNLTDAGLEHNYEFNVQLNDYDDVKFATDEFEKLWIEGISILPVEAEKLKKETHLNNEITPFELYIKLLIEYFDKNIDYDPESIKDLPKNFKKLSYQIDAVSQGFDMLMRHNGFMLSDVVGLGKTVIATMVAKKFILENGLNTKILVIYPPAVEKNWKNTFKYFGIDRYTKFITNGRLSKILDGHVDYWNKEEYDLIIVDEAHKFRNHTTGAFDNLQKICKSPRQNRGYLSGLKKKVILVSATPLNNRPEDILNQIRLFQDERQSTLPITNLTSFFAELIEEYKKIKASKKPDINKLRDIYDKIRKNIIEPITIRRTRKDLENNPEYLKDLQNQGINFPKVNPPQKLEYKMTNELNKLFYKTIDYLTSDDKIQYCRYQAIAYLKREVAGGRYSRAEMSSKNLAFIMKTLLIKRLESSFAAFKTSLYKFHEATQNMIDMFHKNQVIIAPDADINKLIEKGYSDEDIIAEIEKLHQDNPQNAIYTADDFKPKFIEMLKNDHKLITELMQEWNSITEDPKLDVFLQYLDSELLKPNINIEKKLVIFTESAQTAKYLEKFLIDNGRNDVIAIDSSNRKEKQEVIMENFDANFDPKLQKNDLNIIITTEVLAEGVNLHRANVILHYDTPWNSTRMIQRIGRINRIGTKADTLYNFVFYPSVQGDEQLELQKTAFMKLQAFHTAYGEDYQVFSDKEIIDEVKLFTLQAVEETEDERLKYLFFLRKFKDENPEYFQKIKNMSLKCRAARETDKIQKKHLKHNTVVFLKNSKKLEFYLVNDTQITEITPLEAFQIFEAEPNEKPHPITQKYFTHVQKAIQEFEHQETQQVISFSNPEALGAVAMGAKKYLKGLMNVPSQLSPEQKEYIPKIITNIDAGVHANLPTEINKLGKRKIPLHEALTQLDKIAEKYLSEVSTTEKNNHRIEKPLLILSEFFV